MVGANEREDRWNDPEGKRPDLDRPSGEDKTGEVGGETEVTDDEDEDDDLTDVGVVPAEDEEKWKTSLGGISDLDISLSKVGMTLLLDWTGTWP